MWADGHVDSFYSLIQTSHLRSFSLIWYRVLIISLTLPLKKKKRESGNLRFNPAFRHNLSKWCFGYKNASLAFEPADKTPFLVSLMVVWRSAVMRSGAPLLQRDVLCMCLAPGAPSPSPHPQVIHWMNEWMNAYAPFRRESDELRRLLAYI